MRRVRFAIASVGLSLALTLGFVQPAFADTLGSTSDQWNWSANTQYNYCYNQADNPFVRQCDVASIGEVNFRIDIALYGRQAQVTTTYNTPFDDRRIRVQSWVECRKDERIDDSCGTAPGGYFPDFGNTGSYTDKFYLEENGKFFFNLHYKVELEGVPATAADPIDMDLGTSYRIKCSDKYTSQCQFSGRS